MKTYFQQFETVGNRIVNECVELSRCISKGDLKYKVHQKRLNFLYKAHAKVGRDHIISYDEVSKGRLDVTDTLH